MAWLIGLWVVAFAAQAALLGANMWGLVVLSDLEADMMNPHDSAASLNTWMKPEYALQAALAALFLLSGHWLPGLAHAALAGLHARALQRGDAGIDVTEIFKQAPSEKRRRAWRLGLYLLTFIYIIYRLVESAVHALLTPDGKALAQELLHQAAATI